jgi:hypothetical protein
VFNPPLDDPGRGGAGADRPKNLVTLDAAYKVPMVQSYSLGIQQQLSAGMALTVSYVGTRGTHLDRGIQLNYPGPTPDGRSFDPRLNTRTVAIEQIAPYQGWSAITQRQNTAASTYHSMQVDFNRAFRTDSASRRPTHFPRPSPTPMTLAACRRIPRTARRSDRWHPSIAPTW